MLEAKNITKQFPSGEGFLVVFENLSLTVSPGEFVMVTGRSGSGKSTLLYQLGLLDIPQTGDVVIDGVTTKALSRPLRTQLRLTQLGYVFQDYGLLPELNAVDNVMVPLLMRGMGEGEARAIALNALTRAGLARDPLTKPTRLSGGEQQRVSIARAIAHNPRYLLADEPTANLDAAAAAKVLETFGAIHASGTAIVMITHEREALPLASRILELRDRQLIDVTHSYRAGP